MVKTKERKLFYKGKEIKSEDAHKLPLEEKVYLSGRKPIKLKKKEVEN